MEDRNAARVGHVASLTATLCTLAFAVFLILGLTGIPTTMYSFAVCLLLALAFVALMSAIHGCAPPRQRIWSRTALAFAIMYAVFVAACYYVQLAVIRTNSLGLPAESLKPLAYMPGSVMFAVNMLGYALMTLSTLVVIPVFGTTRLEKGLKVLLFIHGILFIPTLVFPMLKMAGATSAASGPDYGSIALLGWCAIFLPLALTLAAWFHRESGVKPKAAKGKHR